MSFRKILSTKLSNQQKQLLRDFYNTENGVNLTSISKIGRRMGLTGDNAYEELRSIYNEYIDDERKQRRRTQRLSKTHLQTIQHLGDLHTAPNNKQRSKPKMSIEKLGGYVKNWLKNKHGHFEIKLKSRIADVSRKFHFNHLQHFENWYSKLIGDHEIDSAGNKIHNDDYDLFKNVVVENIKIVGGGCNSHKAKTIGLKSSFYNYKLYNPTSKGNNCFFACLKYMVGLETSYHNLRKQFQLESGSEITIAQAYEILQKLGYDIQIINYDTNEELEDDAKYIVYQDSHYYVLESFEQVVLKDKKTKRGLLAFDFETRKTDEYDVIKSTGEKLYILKDSLCCVYYRKYKQTECNNVKFISGEKSSARQLIDWFNMESKEGRTYNVIAHNGGRFDYYFFISNLTSAELLECDIHFRGTTIISINYRGHLFKDSACFLTDSLKNLSKSFKVNDGKITKFNLHGNEITSEQLCFYRPELNFDAFIDLQNTDQEFWVLYEKYCLYDCIALFQIWEQFTICVNSLIEKINPYLLRKCPLMSSTTIGSHSKKIIVEINKFKDNINSYKKDLELFTGITYENENRSVEMDKYNFLCNFKRGGISHSHKMGKHMSGITGVDIASQYPASLIYADIPCGKSEFINHYDKNKYGFYLIQDCVFDSYLLKPVALGLKNQSLNWATNNMKELYVDSFMLKYLIHNYGLIDFKVVKGLVSTKSIKGAKIFGKYISTFYEEKKLQDRYKSEKSSLYNEALRSTIKLYLNSLTGKLVENPSIHFSVMFENNIRNDVLNCMKTSNNIKTSTLHGETIYKLPSNTPVNDWIVAGIMVYSYSKRLLFEYIKCLPNNSDDVIHIETDGIYFSTRDLEAFTNNLNNYKGDYPCKFGEDLGNLKIEKTTYEGQVAYFLGKKFYCITMNDDYNNKQRDENDKNIYRIKGFPQKTIEKDGSDKWLVDVSLYEDAYNGKDISRSFETLKKSLFCERTRITSYTMTRKIKGNNSQYRLFV